jgi:hypothetical protein
LRLAADGRKRSRRTRAEKTVQFGDTGRQLSGFVAHPLVGGHQVQPTLQLE